MKNIFKALWAALSPYLIVTLFMLLFMFIAEPALVADLFYEIGEAIPNPFDYARITDVDYKAVVLDEPNNSGKIAVTERLTFDVHAASKNNLFWELWRALPEDKIDGLKVDYQVNSVKQIMPDGTEIVYKESPKLYWDDEDYVNTNTKYGPGKWYHSKGPYSEYKRQYECVLFYVDGLYRDEVVFEIEYIMNNAAFRYGDCSELYLTFYSEDTIKYLESFKGQILVPNKDMPKAGNYSANTYGTNATNFPFTESKTLNPGYHTFAFDLDENDLKFRPHNEYIQFDFISYGEDKHAFTDFAPRNYYYNDNNVLPELKQGHIDYVEEYQKAKEDKTKVFAVCSLIGIIILLYSLNTNSRIKKKYTFYRPTEQMSYFRDIPSDLDPNFAAELVFCKSRIEKNDSDRYAAVLLSLVRKGYIELEKINNSCDWNNSNVKIIIKRSPTPLPFPYLARNSFVPTAKQNTEPLTSSEKYYFDLIVRHAYGKELSMSSFQTKVSKDYINTDSFVTKFENSVTTIGLNQGYFQKSDYMGPKKSLTSIANFYTIVGILLITLVNLISYQTTLDLAFGGFTILSILLFISAWYIKHVSKKFVLLTQFGEDEYQKWRGLYNFLNSYTLMSERTVVELPLWEKYLVYATAFGISEKVVKALKIRCPELPELESNPILNSRSYYRSHSFHSSCRSFSSSTRSASSLA